MADFSDLGGQKIDFSDLGGTIVEDKPKQSLASIAWDATKKMLPFPNIIGGNRATEIAKAPANFVQDRLQKIADYIPDPQRQSVAANIALSLPKFLTKEAAIPLVASTLDPQDIALNMSGEKAVSAAGEALMDEGVGAARRSLGATKMHLHSTKSPFESLRKQAVANRTARDMLENDLISKTGNPNATASNAMDLMATGKQAMSNALAKVDAQGWKADTGLVIQKLKEAVKPKFDDELRAFREITSDIKKYGDNITPAEMGKLLPEGIDSASGLSATEMKKVLKARWGKKGYQDKTVGTAAANVYRKAADETEKQIGNIVQSVDPTAGATYKAGNRSFATGMNSLKYLGNEIAKDMGNNVSSLGGKIMAAGQVGAGDIGGALRTLGLWELASRRGMGVAANALYRTGRGLTGEAAGKAATLGAILADRWRSQKEK